MLKTLKSYYELSVENNHNKCYVGYLDLNTDNRQLITDNRLKYVAIEPEFDKKYIYYHQMHPINYKQTTIYSLFIVFALILASCKGLQKDTVVYFNDFENDSLTNIIRGKIGAYNGSRVIGRYSQDGFILRLDSLPIHNMLQISFDLYIHDTWDGNSIKPEGPDIWIMNVDGWSAIYATFANGQFTTYTQSYPVLQPDIDPNTGLKFFNNKPNSNAIKTDLPGACKLQKINGGTSLYRITRTIEHTTSTLEVGCFAQLEDPDMVNKNCNESWSIDNIKIKTIEFK